jgi:argininosuccinate synthase
MPGKDMVLAYSGGLDTSCILKWNLDKGYNVIAYMADLGQKADFRAAEKKARRIGAKDVRIVDLKEEFITEYVFPAIRANAMYEGRYLLGTSLARPPTAKTQVDIARQTGATVLSHGATGKGNDQVRFENAYNTFMPGAEIYAPWKEADFRERFEERGRDALMEYAQAHGIPIDQTTEEPWSSDDNAMHISYEAGMLEKPMAVPFERMFQMTKSPQEAPDEETLLEIDFERGNPVRVREILSLVHDPKTGLLRNLEYGREYTDPVELFLYLNDVAGENGVGRVDMVESRFVGMKSRGVYETPGGTVLQFTHKDLEGITLDREIIRANQHTSIELAERIYSGFWFSPEREHFQNNIDSTQQVVNGKVRVSLYKGNIIPRGRSSPDSLYDEKIVSMHEKGGYNPGDAAGFIKITAIRLRASQEVKERKGQDS